jgi:hypothetical protein
MGTLISSVLSKDLDHIIGQNESTLTGVHPAGILGEIYKGIVQGLEEGRSVEINGVEQEVSASILINAGVESNLPSLGSILQGDGNRQYKVVSIATDATSNPLAYKMDCVQRYAS